MMGFCTAWGRGSRPVRKIGLVLLTTLIVSVGSTAVQVGCGSDDQTGSATTSSGEGGGAESGDVTGYVGAAVAVANARITVSFLEESFQPTVPAQRLSDETPSQPATGQSLYQAFIRVENRAESPIRVDPEEFVCQLGNVLVLVEPTRSGPAARSLLKSTSLDLILTFIGSSGETPVLVYAPEWYDGTIRIAAGNAGASTTSTISSDSTD
jgi:hypothetical protein